MTYGARFGQMMARIRGDLGVTQADLAEQVFGSTDRKGDISKIENGKVARPQAKTVAKICGALGIEAAEVEALKSDDDKAVDGTVERLLTENAALADQLKLSEALVVSLAYDYAEGNPTDFDGAMRGLRRAFEVAAEEQEKSALSSNIDDAVSDIVRKVDEYNARGLTDEGADYLAEEEARAEAGLIRLYDKGIAQAILTRDVEAAVAYELKKLPLDVPDPAAQFEALGAVFKEWWDRGREKGLNFDLEVAVALGEAMFARASGSFQRGDSLNCEAVAMQDLADRDPNQSLEEVVGIKRRVLDHWTRRDHPQEWAMAQMNLGVTLQTLGERENGTERLGEAVTAYREALKENTRERVPLKWAMTQMNLGNALATLGRREAGTKTLEEAVTAYREALKERTREQAPLQWAMTQMNLGNALRNLGTREPGTKTLEEAATAYREALTENTRERVPLVWAKTQINLGNALLNLGAREPGTDKLEEAVKAYDEALKEFTRERAPLQWANTLGNQGSAFVMLAEHEGDAGIARQALDQLTTAESVLREGGHFAWAKTFERQIPKAQALLDTLTSGDKS